MRMRNENVAKTGTPPLLSKKQLQEKEMSKIWERMQRNEELAKHGSKRA